MSKLWSEIPGYWQGWHDRNRKQPSMREDLDDPLHAEAYWRGWNDCAYGSWSLGLKPESPWIISANTPETITITFTREEWDTELRELQDQGFNKLHDRIADALWSTHREQLSATVQPDWARNRKA